MRAGKIVGFIVIIIIVCVLIVGGCLYSGYNHVISLDEQVKSSWAQVENQLQRRYDLIPNLVETVKGYSEHEKEVFLGIANARKAYFQADTRAGKIEASQGLERALSRLLVLREQYPELKANQSFLKLQDQLEGTENRLAVERMRYNEAVKRLDTYIRTVTGRIYANLAGVGPAEYFKVEEAARAAPKVNFSGKSEGG